MALRPLAKSVGLVDKPGGRKAHQGEVPIIGGIAMYIGLVTGLVLLYSGRNVAPYLPLSAGLLVVIGVLDDRYDVKTAFRFVVQLSAVILMVYGAGLVLGDMGDPFGFGVIHTGPFALIFTLLVVIATINAFNVVDGVDGLSGSLALITLLSVALVASIGGQEYRLPLVGVAAIVAFLLFNFPMSRNRRVRSFMGDAGSTMVGLVVVWATIGICQGPERLASPVICLWFAALPIFDLFTCFVRRIRKGKPPTAPGREHLHHELKRGGFGVREILGILTIWQVVYALIGLIGLYGRIPDVVMFAAWSVAGFSQYRLIHFIARNHRLKLKREMHDRLPGASGHSSTF